MRNIDGKAGMRSFTKNEYLERLSNMIPDSYKPGRLIVTADTVKTATTMVEDLADALHDAFDGMVETDLVVEVKNTARDLYALGRFLDISYEVIMGVDSGCLG
ncbi:MAG: hypothetical protein K940chlam3_00096 [Chlamydiae bacterium]|nr:hypothetical protein [Chlamydiota bacterium]